MSVNEPRLVVERYLTEVLNGGKPDGAAELIADDTLRRRVAAFRRAFPDVRATTERVLAEGSLVAVHLSSRGTHIGTFEGCPPTGREWEATCTAIHRVEGGRIAEVWSNWDSLAVMEQLGCVRRVETVSA
jgi:steroid delta-isomerase-like uncharacterized protein